MKTSRLKAFLLTLGLLLALTLLLVQAALAGSLNGVLGTAEFAIAQVASELAQATEADQAIPPTAESDRSATDRSQDQQESVDRQPTQEDQNPTQDAVSQREEDATPKSTQPKSPYDMDAIEDFDRALYGS